MFVKKNLGFRAAFTFTGGHIIWLTAWAILVTWLYEYLDWKWMKIPWLPLSVIGVAVAFYIGFKNNQSYDRL
jgi:putative membrane protein